MKLSYFQKKIKDVPWKKNKIDIIIDASGTNANVDSARKVLKDVKKIIITLSPKKNIDFTMIFGVNEKKYDHGPSEYYCHRSGDDIYSDKKTR